MSTVSTSAAPKSLQEWLDELVLAHWREARAVSLRALSEGHDAELVICDRHGTAPMRLPAAASHVISTESEWEQVSSGEPRLHLPGDIRVAGPAAAFDEGVESPWTTSRCRFCQRPIIWASTASGARVPVDPDPNPAGNVVLRADLSQGLAGDPIAMFISNPDADASGVTPAQLHTRHRTTCPASGEWRNR